MKNFQILILLIFSILGLNYSCNAQLSKYIHRVDTLFEPSPRINYSVFSKGSKNDLESTFSVVFILYKNLISSQDIDACVFQPSCSVYAIECIHHEKSKITAFLKISDRLMRCHPLVSPGTYKIDDETGKYFDPIEN